MIVILWVVAIVCMACDAYEKNDGFRKYVDNIKKNKE